MPTRMVANIQVLRGVAATLVVWHHLQAMVNSTFGTSFASSIGTIGVDIFFVISGFIMFYRGYSTPDRIPFFLISRFFRIVPLYWLGTFALVALFLLGFNPNGVHHLTPTTVLESVFFIPTALPDGRHELVLSLGWTLMYELFFYALFAISFFARSRVLSFVLIAVALCSTSLIGTLVDGLSYLQMYYLAPITIEFLYGAILGLIFDKISIKSKRVLLSGAAASFLAAVSMLFAFYELGLVDVGKFGARFLTFGIPAFLIVLAALLLEKANVRKDSGALIRWGDISYSLYLFHPLTLQAAIKGADQVVPQNTFGIGLAIIFAMGITLAASWIIYDRIETRLVAFGKRVAKRALPKSEAQGRFAT